MSFTFRDLFSEDGTEASGENREVIHPEDGSSQRGTSSMKSEDRGEVQYFLVSELLPFIPPAISAQSGIPMEKEVAVPIPAQGGRDVELSTLYQVCPELFATEITPLNDSVVTLPAKLGGIEAAPSAASPFAAPPARPANPPRDSVSNPQREKRSTKSEEENPFWSTAAASAAAPKREAHSSPPKQVVTGAKGFGSGFQATPPNEQAPSPPADSVFGAPINKLQGEEPDTAARGSENEATSAGQEEIPSFGFGSGLAAGNQNPFDSTEGFATLFSKEAQKDEEIPYPTEADQGGAPSAQPDAPEGKPFASSAFDSFLPDSAKSNVAASDPAPEVQEKPSSGTLEPLSGFSSPTSFSAPISSEASASKPPTEAAAQRDTQPPAQPEPTPEPQPPAESESGPVSDQEAKLEIPEEKKTEEVPSISATAGSSASISLGVTPTATKSEPSHHEEDETLRDLEFKAIFSTSESFTLAKVARSVVSLEGITGCALATPNKIVQASKGEQGRLGDEAREMVDSIRNLARLSGLPEAKSFTLNTDRGTVSLFLEGDSCVTIHHETDDFGPGVREKLILVARSIHKLEE